MIEIYLVGIGTGNPKHLTLEGTEVLKDMELILLPKKSSKKKDLLKIRKYICDLVINQNNTLIEEYLIPERSDNTDYFNSVSNWHLGISKNIEALINKHKKRVKKLAFLIWGDPGLYDSTLKIVDKLKIKKKVNMISGISSIQSLTSAFKINLNEIGGSVLVTTGRNLNKEMFCKDFNILVMLDGNCSFKKFIKQECYIWWGAYLGMKNQILIEGKLKNVCNEIICQRKKNKAIFGWIMDTYLIKKS